MPTSFDITYSINFISPNYVNAKAASTVALKPMRTCIDLNLNQNPSQLIKALNLMPIDAFNQTCNLL